MANIIVLFEVKPTKAWMQRYLDLAASLKPLLAGFEGFIRAERFTSLNEEGKLLSMNVWTDEEAVSRWRNAMEHRMSQKEGITIVLSGVNPKVEHVLKRNHFDQLLGEENICNHIDLALERARNIVKA